MLWDDVIGGALLGAFLLILFIWGCGGVDVNLLLS